MDKSIEHTKGEFNSQGVVETKNPATMKDSKQGISINMNDIGYSDFNANLPTIRNVGSLFQDYDKDDKYLGNVSRIESGDFDIETLRGKNQGLGEKIGNSLVQYTILAGTTYINNTVGLANGIIEATGTLLFSPFLEGEQDPGTHIHNNFTSRLMQDVQDWTRDKFKVHRGNDYYNKSLQEKLATGVFWSDLYSNLGFTAGTLLSMASFSGILKKGAAKIFTKSIAAQNVSAALTGSFLAASGEATAEATNFVKTRTQEQQGIAIKTYKELVEKATSVEELTQLEKEYYETLDVIERESKLAANSVYAYNVGVVGGSNLLQYGWMFGKGFIGSKLVKNNAARQASKYRNANPRTNIAAGNATPIKGPSKAWEWTKFGASKITHGIAEGMEEVTQGAIQEAGNNMTKYNSFNESKFNPEKRELASSFAAALGEAFVNRWGSEEMKEEFAMGFFTGVVGVPSFKRNEAGKIRPTLVNNILLEGIQKHRELKKQESFVDQANEILSKEPEKLLSYYENLVTQFSLEEEKKKALEENRGYDYRNTEAAQLFSNIITFSNAGATNVLHALVQEAANLSDEQLQQMIDNSEPGTFFNPDGNKLTVEQAREIVNKNANKLEESINVLEKSKNALSALNINNEAMKEALYYDFLINDHATRSKDLGSSLYKQLEEAQKKLQSIEKPAAVEVDSKNSVKVQNPLGGTLRVDPKDVYYDAKDTKKKNPILKKDALLKYLYNKDRDNGLLQDVTEEQFTLALQTDPNFREVVISLVGDPKHVAAIGIENVEKIQEGVKDMGRLTSSMIAMRLAKNLVLENPESRELDPKKIEANNKKKELSKKANIVAEDLLKSNSYKEFKQKLKNLKEEDETKNKAIEILKNRKDPKYQEWSKIDNYIKAVEEKLEAKTKDDRVVNSKAKKLFEHHYDNLDSLEDISNKNSEWLSDYNAVEDQLFNGAANELSSKKAHEAILQAMTEVASSNEFVKNFTYNSTPKAKKQGKVVRKKQTGITSGTTTSSNTQSQNTSNTNNSNSNNNQKIPEGKNPSGLTAEEVKYINEQLNKMQEVHEQMRGKTFFYYITAIPEYVIESVKARKFIRFSDLQKNSSYKVLYSFLEEKQAFKYVNEGKLKEGTKIRFTILPEFETKNKKYNKGKIENATIFMITEDGQIVGVLKDNENIKSGNNKGGIYKNLNKVRKTIIEEYKNATVLTEEERNQKLADLEKNKKEKLSSTFKSSLQTSVSQILVGTPDYIEEERDLNDILTEAEKSDVKILIINSDIKQNKTITNSNVNIQDIEHLNTIPKGVYLLLPNARGKYFPVAVRMKYLNEYSIEDIINSNNKYLQDFYNVVNRIKECTSKEDFQKVYSELTQYLYFDNNIHIDFIEDPNDATNLGIKIVRSYKDSLGNDITETINGKTVRKETGGTVFFNDTKKKKNKTKQAEKPQETTNEDEDVEIEEGEEQTVQVVGSFSESGELVENSSSEESSNEESNIDVTEKILQLLSEIQVPFQVNKQDVSIKESLRKKVEGGIMYTNLNSTEIKGNFFTVNALEEKNGKLEETENKEKVFYTKPLSAIANPINNINSKEINGSVYTKNKNNEWLDSEGNIPDIETLAKLQALEQIDNNTNNCMLYVTDDGYVKCVFKNKGKNYNIFYNINDGSIISNSNKELYDKIKNKYDKKVEEINSINNNIETLQNKIKENQKKYKGRDENKYQIETEQGVEEFDRVHSLYNSSKKYDKSNKAPLEVGNIIDEIVRQFFIHNGDKSKLSKPDNMTQEAYDTFINGLMEWKQMLEDEGLHFITDNIVLFHKFPNKAVAGELDILCYNDKGEIFIVDCKSSKAVFGNNYKNEDYSKQLSLYKDMFEAQYGVKVSGLYIFPVTVNYNGSKQSDGNYHMDTMTSALTYSSAVPVYYDNSVRSILGLNTSTTNIPLSTQSQTPQSQTQPKNNTSVQQQNQPIVNNAIFNIKNKFNNIPLFGKSVKEIVSEFLKKDFKLIKENSKFKIAVDNNVLNIFSIPTSWISEININDNTTVTPEMALSMANKISYIEDNIAYGEYKGKSFSIILNKKINSKSFGKKYKQDITDDITNYLNKVLEASINTTTKTSNNNQNNTKQPSSNTQALPKVVSTATTELDLALTSKKENSTLLSDLSKLIKKPITTKQITFNGTSIKCLGEDYIIKDGVSLYTASIQLHNGEVKTVECAYCPLLNNKGEHVYNKGNKETPIYVMSFICDNEVIFTQKASTGEAVPTFDIHYLSFNNIKELKDTEYIFGPALIIYINKLATNIEADNLKNALIQGIERLSGISNNNPALTPATPEQNKGNKQLAIKKNLRHRRIRVSTPTNPVIQYTEESLQKEIEWLQNVLPSLSRADALVILDSLIDIADSGEQVWGNFEDCIITLSKLAEVGSLYHEAFHGVFNMFFTEQERAIMLEEARRKYGNRDVITLEEYIAEDFREFMLMGAKDNRSFGRKFIDLLKRLANMVQNYHLFQPSSTYYFNAINKGKFKNAVPKRVHVSRRMTTRQQLDEALNEFDSIYSDDPAVQRECEEIKAKAIANGTFMKAPNGKQTKLDERQWLHVRTKAFKEWFGDWERLAELEIELSKFNSDNSEKNSNFTSEAKPFKGDASNKKHYLTIAPYFREKLSSQNRAELERKTAEVKERVINFAKALGLNISVVETNAGVFEGSPEISYTYHVTGGTQEEIDLFTSLMGDISNEYQDAVIAANYVDENSKELVNAWELNYNVPKGSSIEEVMQYLSENNIDGTFNLNTNTLTIIAFSKEQSAEIVKYLKEKKYEHKQTKLQNSRYLENGDRRNIYKSWLETHVGESNRLLDNACRKADFICEAAAKFSRKDQEAERIKAAREAAEKWDREHQAEENVLNSTPSQSIESLQKEYDELKGKVSKVVDENGEPMTTWHSSPSEIENNTFRDKYTVTIDKGEEWVTNKDINDYIKEGFIVSEEDIKAYKEGKSITILKPNGIYSSSKKEVSNTYTQLEYEAYDKFDEKIQHEEDTRAETWSLEEEGLFNKHLKDIKKTDKDNPYVYGSKQYNDYFYNKAAELAKKEMLERHPEGRKEFVNPTNPFNYTNNVLGSEIEIFSSLKNPLIIDAHNSNWNSIEFNGRIYSTRTLEEYARNNGYDGVIVKNVYDIGGHARRGSIMTSTVVTALKPNQIKSATDNNGQYSRENDSIRMYIDQNTPTSPTQQQREIANQTVEHLEKSGFEVKNITEDNIDEFFEDYNKQAFIGNKAREQYENILRKNRPDMSEADIKEALDFLHLLEDNKENTAYIKAAVKWISNGSINLPRDYVKARQIFNIARGRNINIDKYKSLTDLLLSDEMKPTERKTPNFDPDKEPKFTNKRTEVHDGMEFTIYDVEDSPAGQEAVCKAVAQHYIESPWCLATFTNTFKPTASAKEYWNNYSALPRKIAYYKGRPVAFSSSSSRGIERINYEGLVFERDVPFGNSNDYSKFYIYNDNNMLYSEFLKLEDLEKKGIVKEDAYGFTLSPDIIKKLELPIEKIGNAWWDLMDKQEQPTLGNNIVTSKGDLLFIPMDRHRLKDYRQLTLSIPGVSEKIIFYEYDNTYIIPYKRSFSMYGEDVTKKVVAYLQDNGYAGEVTEDDYIYLTNKGITLLNIETKYNNHQYFKTKNGELYGYVDSKGIIHLDKKKITAEHPVHEYTHLWDRSVQQRNPELWGRGVELMKQISLWEEIANDKNYGQAWIAEGKTGTELDNLIASEVHARLVGREGYELLNELAAKQGAKGIIEKLKAWILEMWRDLASTFGHFSQDQLNNLTLEDFNRMTMRDFAFGTNLKDSNQVSVKTMRNTKGEVISMAQYRALNNLPAPNSFATLTDQQQQAVEEYGLSEEDYDGLTEQAKEYLKHCLL